MAMTQMEALSRRIARAENELASLRTRATITTLIAAAAVLATLSGGWWAPLVAAGDGAPMTVRAPFTVTDANGKPIVSIIDEATSTSTMSSLDGKSKQTQTRPVSNRGLHVFNAAGDTVARAAVSGGNGYVVVRQAGGGSGLGGPGAGLVASKDGLELSILGTDDKSVRLSSDYGGLQFESDGGTILTQLNRSGLTIANEKGSNVVEASILVDGRGVVRVGPRFGGPLGPGQLGFSYQIIGRK
jgi:hypothetical protein